MIMIKQLHQVCSVYASRPKKWALYVYILIYVFFTHLLNLLKKTVRSILFKAWKAVCGILFPFDSSLWKGTFTPHASPSHSSQSTHPASSPLPPRMNRSDVRFHLGQRRTSKMGKGESDSGRRKAMARSKPKLEILLFFFGREVRGEVRGGQNKYFKGHFNGHTSRRLAKTISRQSSFKYIRRERAVWINLKTSHHPSGQAGVGGRGGVVFDE